MRTSFPLSLLLLVAVAPLPSARAARMPDPQQVMRIDLDACPKPAYPPAALAARASGMTTIEMQVGTTGLLTDVRVARSSGRADLDAAAMAGMRRCVFHAVLATGQAPTGWLKTQYVWIPGAFKQTQAQNEALHASTVQLAEGGDAVAQNRLGTWFEHGTYAKPDLVQAAHWYRLAADQGNAWAQNNLGVLYFRGVGVPHDQKLAAEWYAKAAEQGHGWAQANLAWAYQHGVNGPVDTEKAVYWLTRAAEGGLVEGQLRLGLVTMALATSDEERAAAAGWIARAADRGFAPAIYYLGRTFELGLGNAQDDAQAAAQYRKVLTRSEGRAETALGIMTEAGRAGAPDLEGAAKLYQRGMQARHADAFYHYGLVLEQRGEAALAVAVFRQGAEVGSCEAVVKYVQVRPAAAATGVAGASDTALAQRATACAARPDPGLHL